MGLDHSPLSASSAIVLLIIGSLGFINSNTNATRVIGGLLVALNFAYNVTIGQICYRQISIVLSRISSQIKNIVCGIIVPMLSPTAWNWGPKSGFFELVRRGCRLLIAFLGY